jgi:hypothetical protein
MEHFGCQEAVLSTHSSVMQTKNQISILVTPPKVDLIESVDRKKIISPQTEIAAADPTP